MSATWPDAPVIENGVAVSYRHPVPERLRDGVVVNPIEDLAIVAVCAAHDAFRTAALPPDPYYGAAGYLLASRFASPTEAERLYLHLYRYTGQRASLVTCDCHAYEVIDRSGAEALTRKQHARHSRKCEFHPDDDDQHTHAIEQNGRWSATESQARSLLNIMDTIADRPRFLALQGAWSYSGTGANRVLTVHLSSLGATTQQRNQAQNWADTRFGVGKVLIT